MNTYTNDCIGKNVILKETTDPGIILFFEYMTDLNHYCFKIKTKDKIIICFNEENFIII